jgi:hypothetical protein
VLARSDAGAAHPAAEFGLGRVALADRSFADAHRHFENAARGFAALNLTTQETEARAALEKLRTDG